jgi:transcription-repair coupling factor (superfamily II helicase)
MSKKKKKDKLQTSDEALTESISAFNYLKEKLTGLNKKEKLFTSSFAGSSRNLFIKTISEKEKHIFILCQTVTSVNETKVELTLLGLEKDIVTADDLSAEVLQEKLTDLNNREKFILVSTYELLKLNLPTKNSIQNNTTKLAIGGSLTYDELVEYLNLINYNEDKYVDEPGVFAVRGSIIDFWSFSEKQPCRLEFDGDFLESIRHFDPESQRSSNKVENTTLAAALNSEEVNQSGDIFDYLDNPLVFANEYELEKLFTTSGQNENTEIIITEDEVDEELKKELYEEEIETVEKVTEEQFEENKNVSFVKLFDKNARWIIEDQIGIHNERIELNFLDAPVINSNFELLFNFLKDSAGKDFQIMITVENDLQKNRLIELLSEYKTELADLIERKKIGITVFPIKAGFISKKEKIAILTDYQIFNKPYRTKISAKQKIKKSRSRDFASIKRGDFVVHENFGIGQYAGLETIKIGQVEQESIKILYAEGGVVYVNLNYLSLVKKFSSNDNVQPRLSVLGSGEWKSIKKKVKARIKEAARELITLYAKRKAAQGYSFSPDSIWQKELEASFLYEDTPDQTKITEEIKTDMEGENPMDRLVCGDVGFGKTEIAVRAAFKAINDSKQTAVLVPTTILAEQHYNTFKDRLSQFPVKVEVISRFRSTKEQKEIVAKLTKGEVDIVIGTHRLLSKDIVFKDLGLLIIDEEHRFGVMAKEKLRSLKANVDTLTLTATPIPRTLNLSLLGARDLSLLSTPPPNRQSINTKVDKFDIVKVREWILNEIKRGGQIYFVHDRVQSIDKIASYIQKYIPEISFGIAHGQMKPTQLEKVIFDFLNKKYHMLIATKIIESGLDIPNVNTIIINRADRFGLAELHQLRGRVGRSDRQAYAYLLVPSLNTITKKAVKRLQAIEEYTEIGGGFNLSMRDLEIRGSGNLLGTEQSGYIDSVGFDLYLKMVDEAVEELKQGEFKDVFKDLPKSKEKSEPTIDTYFEIGIPQNYMPDQADRLSFYTALFSVINIEEMEELKEEMTDRFGKFPKIVEHLIAAAVLRFHASFALFERIVVQKNKIIIILPKGDREDYYQNKFTTLLSFVNNRYSKDIKFVQNDSVLKLEMSNKYSLPEKVMEFLIKFTKEVIEVVSGK